MHRESTHQWPGACFLFFCTHTELIGCCIYSPQSNPNQPKALMRGQRMASLGVNWNVSWAPLRATGVHSWTQRCNSANQNFWQACIEETRCTNHITAPRRTVKTPELSTRASTVGTFYFIGHYKEVRRTVWLCASNKVELCIQAKAALALFSSWPGVFIIFRPK